MTADVRRVIVSALKQLEDISDKERVAPPKSRAGKKAIAGHFDPAVAWQLKKLALDRRMTVQALLDEALGDLFEKHYLPRLIL